MFENVLSPLDTPRSSDTGQGLVPIAVGRSSAGGGPLGDRGLRDLTLRARGSRSAQGRNGPGVFERRGRRLFRDGTRPDTLRPLRRRKRVRPLRPLRRRRRVRPLRQRWQAMARSPPDAAEGRPPRGMRWWRRSPYAAEPRPPRTAGRRQPAHRPGSGHPAARRAPCGPRGGTTGASPAPSPDRAGRSRPAPPGSLSGLSLAREPPAPLPIRAGNRRPHITVVLPSGRKPDRRRATHAGPLGGGYVRRPAATGGRNRLTGDDGTRSRDAGLRRRATAGDEARDGDASRRSAAPQRFTRTRRGSAPDDNPPGLSAWRRRRARRRRCPARRPRRWSRPAPRRPTRSR